jgi:hypothetical protein
MPYEAIKLKDRHSAVHCGPSSIQSRPEMFKETTITGRSTRTRRRSKGLKNGVPDTGRNGRSELEYKGMGAGLPSPKTPNLTPKRKYSYSKLSKYMTEKRENCIIGEPHIFTIAVKPEQVERTHSYEVQLAPRSPEIQLTALQVEKTH